MNNPMPVDLRETALAALGGENFEPIPMTINTPRTKFRRVIARGLFWRVDNSLP
jgi:hypothetical protein